MGRPAKDKRDIYYRKAKEEGWRARSAYKLLHLTESFRFFGRNCKATNFVDLCCAPGSWSQALSRATSRSSSTIVSVDLQDIAPIAGVDAFVGDITTEATAAEIVKRFDGQRADVVVCDGAPDVSGLHDLDEFLQTQLVVAAATIAVAVLRPGGVFVSKTFRGASTDALLSRLRMFFASCCVAKPRSSRSSSAEGFFVCRLLAATPHPPPSVSVVATAAAVGGAAAALQALTSSQTTTEQEVLCGTPFEVVDFIAVGSLGGADSGRRSVASTTSSATHGGGVQMHTTIPALSALAERESDALVDLVFEFPTDLE